MIAEAVLVVDEAALMRRSPDSFGKAAYHLRVFGPGAGLPVIILGDLGNHYAASVTNRFDEIAFIVLQWALKRRGHSHAELRSLARWVEYYCEGAHGGSLPESFAEIWFDPPSRPGGFPALRSQQLYHDDIEKMAGGRVASWRARDYTAEVLTRRGIGVIRAGAL
ncbi:hypothetical protein JIG36_34165 [Actinoplanes sp. LDG1-06]|uniref:Uncharacterized protein n=1 Tax=Paractinoplanes ovalisporus TaxID=2810368 RepID=A0ABS2AL42_9ACTN|nr:hypothetical protein [Actinoplanes ovalisporus]MBM2620559.1 hypothetical protein [Actinoplanes ovalisporus]